MEERLAMFVDNVEKIRLYFGTEADKFALSMAVSLTLRSLIFYYFEYEKVEKTIKDHSKWYSILLYGIG